MCPEMGPVECGGGTDVQQTNSEARRAPCCGGRPGHRPAGAGRAPPSRKPEVRGAVYTISNDPSGNALVVFDQGERRRPHAGRGDRYRRARQRERARLTGRSRPVQGRPPSGGQPGERSSRAFRVGRGGPVLASTVASGSDLPISVAIHGGLAYVLNAGGEGNVTGFGFRTDGRLIAVAGSTPPACGATVARLDRVQRRWPVSAGHREGNQPNRQLPSAPRREVGAALSTPSAGETPFGFSVSGSTVVVSEAFGGAADASAVSSYRLGPRGRLTPLSASVGTTETAACWIAITPNARFAYTTNTGSDSVTGYRIGASRLRPSSTATGLPPPRVMFPSTWRSPPTGRFCTHSTAGQIMSPGSPSALMAPETAGDHRRHHAAAWSG